jgi:hypothetical protein
MRSMPPHPHAGSYCSTARDSGQEGKTACDPAKQAIRSGIFNHLATDAQPKRLSSQAIPPILLVTLARNYCVANRCKY